MKNIITLNMKSITIAFLLTAFTPALYAINPYELYSPDKNIKVIIEMDHNGIFFSVDHKTRPLLLPSQIDMILNESVIEQWKVKKVSRRSENSVIVSPVPE